MTEVNASEVSLNEAPVEKKERKERADKGKPRGPRKPKIPAPN